MDGLYCICSWTLLHMFMKLAARFMFTVISLDRAVCCVVNGIEMSMTKIDCTVKNSKRFEERVAAGDKQSVFRERE